ncbi:hypothetical protein WT01_16755 [Burkholderia cepacia]|nr:hypothetical protein WT01_16755 [Burkholderia cepacia]
MFALGAGDFKTLFSVRQFGLTVAMRTMGRYRRLLIQCGADRGKRLRIQFPGSSQAADQRGNFRIHSAARAQHTHIARRAFQFISLAAQLFFEPVGTRLGRTQLLKEIEFLALNVA